MQIIKDYVTIVDLNNKNFIFKIINKNTK